ncbi:aminotransferase class I/II-fold pyridoxal phosphate-dependent enzyme [Pelagicoccus sp. SDUM812002]|uniref:aminotransferase class I/II-fold pyridoxal phosphate-dependent enzyme n=1 Tax=Pelagicoccus sp. SDUM812002 TaxID=3041266 RepID=UPI0028100FEC|nr:aminotransferase class I/II-fold pyridoxal phosphate-dependent enzyme [Pelagicoccus sp. SDUM812002]MDQ8184558.1 aminotransferase class I/II-fold pyridoxal phosphate-dependent enzyme [Pelagicoccus sp. SDUM812002]
MIRKFFNSKALTPIAQRCEDDKLTTLRQKYDLYYEIAEEQSGTHITIEGQDLVMLASNEYLGLSLHPKVIEAGKAALEKWGSGTMGARSANGGRRFHRELEEEIAAFLGKESCHVFAAGYLACMASITGFAQRGDIILADKNLHSSIWDGIRLSMADVERFSHNNPARLRAILEQLDPQAPKLLSIEGIYSMEGHIAALPEMMEVAKEYQCFVSLDDAHGIGVLGKQGRGTANYFGLTDEVDIIAGSLSKSLASTGGFVAGAATSIEFLRTHCKQSIFSAAISPAQAACARAALKVMQDEPEWNEQLWTNTKRYKALLKELELDIWDSETPAVPIVLGDRERAYYFWKHLREKGIFTVISTAPGVPPGKDLVRTAVSARHSEQDFEQIESALRYACKKL